MSFPNGIEPTPYGVRVYPTPLHDLAAGVLIAWWLWHRAGKPHAIGIIVGYYLVLSGIARFSVEFIRRNPHVLFGLSNAQLASLGSVIAGASLIFWAARRRVSEQQQTASAVEKPA
jgi:phosphatidylglycerol:prolipoprotein diacylglycerol transferase